jgi:o-succinylbenzoate synthase
MLPIIKGVAAYKTRLPLRRPYHLSLITLDCFDSVMVHIETEGEMGYGETTGVPGYFTENLGDAWKLVSLYGPELLGKNLEEALDRVVAQEKKLSFAATPLVTALESITGSTKISAAGSVSVPLLGVVQGETVEEIESDAKRLLMEGYHTLKFKVGFSVTKDLERVCHLQTLLLPGVRIRLDANQAYSYSQAVQFVEGLDPTGIELLEQPLGTDAWDDMSRLVKICPVPLMLDEAITGEEELDRTIETGCAGVVKFKLMKCGSFRYLENLIKKAVNAGLKVILGNGVATDIGCFHEAQVAHRTGLTVHAGEMNGFLKGVDQFLEPPLRMEGENLILPACQPAVRWEIFSQYIVEELSWGDINSAH